MALVMLCSCGVLVLLEGWRLAKGTEHRLEVKIRPGFGFIEIFILGFSGGANRKNIPEYWYFSKKPFKPRGSQVDSFFCLDSWWNSKHTHHTHKGQKRPHSAQ
jgi:hypothetical protein